MTIAAIVNLAAGALLLGSVAFALLLLALLGALVFRA